MTRKKSTTPSEEFLLLPTPPSFSPIVDTHTHVATTFSFYRRRYKHGRYTDIFQFVRALYEGRAVKALVDVWCEAPVRRMWKKLADSALNPEDRTEKWGGVEYWFVMGVHPHEAQLYNDQVENDILEAMTHPRCVGWGEIGLDYHYDHSPRDVQRQVFTRQLRQAVKLQKALTIHTREADDDTERILKEEVPPEYKIHIHCFSDAPEFAQRLLDHFPNLWIGITGVVTYATNANTAAVIQNMALSNPDAPLRILLETDAPFMVPANLYDSLPLLKGKLPLCHTAMIPWTAQFIANAAGERWNVERVMRDARDGARLMYGV